MKDSDLATKAINKLKYSIYDAVELICKHEISLIKNSIQNFNDDQYNIESIPEEDSAIIGTKLDSSSSLRKDEWQVLLEENSRPNDIS